MMKYIPTLKEIGMKSVPSGLEVYIHENCEFLNAGGPDKCNPSDTPGITGEVEECGEWTKAYWSNGGENLYRAVDLMLNPEKEMTRSYAGMLAMAFGADLDLIRKYYDFQLW